MNVTDFIGLLESRKLSPRKSGTGWEAHCPAHSDGNASLSVSEGNDGRILVHCHAGCSAGSIVGALGLKLGNLFSPRANGGNNINEANNRTQNSRGTRISRFIKYLFLQLLC